MRISSNINLSHSTPMPPHQKEDQWHVSSKSHYPHQVLISDYTIPPYPITLGSSLLARLNREHYSPLLRPSANTNSVVVGKVKVFTGLFLPYPDTPYCSTMPVHCAMHRCVLRNVNAWMQKPPLIPTSYPGQSNSWGFVGLERRRSGGDGDKGGPSTLFVDQL